MESYHNAQNRKYTLLEMPTRADDKKMPLVRVVEKGKQKADDDRPDAAALEYLDGLEHLLLVERDFDRAARRQDALGHRDAVPPSHQRLLLPGHVEVQREIIRPLMAADMKNVAKVARGEHADFGAIVLDRDVGGDGRAVHD